MIQFIDTYLTGTLCYAKGDTAMQSSKKTATGGLIAALYVVLTYLAELLGLASGAIQVRFSESLTLLPCLTPTAIPGLTVGCLLANFMTGCAPWDVVFGTMATLFGAIGTYALRRKPYLLWLPPVISNTLIVPIILINVYGVEEFWPLIALQIFVGEMISCCFLGTIVLRFVRKHYLLS